MRMSHLIVNFDAGVKMCKFVQSSKRKPLQRKPSCAKDCEAGIEFLPQSVADSFSVSAASLFNPSGCSIHPSGHADISNTQRCLGLQKKVCFLLVLTRTVLISVWTALSLDRNRRSSLRPCCFLYTRFGTSLHSSRRASWSCTRGPR